MDCIMQGLAKKKTPWKENLFFTVKSVRQKLSKYSSEVPPKIGMPLLSANILDPFHKMPLFRKWNNAMNIYPKNGTSYATQ